MTRLHLFVLAIPVWLTSAELPEIKNMLATLRLDFLGFISEPVAMARYRQRFPNDRAMTDLDQWHIFETENPETFLGMYQFHVQAAR